ncbi:MAG TPA: GerMN domain-containing protein [Candidatus Acidoferrales bacterium]|nr:GerMN domain-containing protein [Candidatus Acidoferrales bacterium]
MPRNLKIALGILAAAVLIGLASLGGLHERMKHLSENPTTDEQARRAVLAAPIATPTDVTAQAKIFWAAGADGLAPVSVEIPLSSDPAERAKQVLNELISNPPAPEQRTLPADTALLGFYILPDGTAIADFSDALVAETPSGISSEEDTIDSIVETLQANVPSLRRLKILVHGQEADTLAGHIDLTGFFDLNAAAAQVPASLRSQVPAGSALPPNAAR